MDEQPITETSAGSPGAEEALPEQTAEQPADSTSEQQDKSSTAGDAGASVPEVDEKLKAYAESKGITLDSEGALKAAKIAMDNQAEYQRTRQQASELGKALQQPETPAQGSEDDPALARIQAVELKLAVNDFWQQEGHDRTLEPKMAEIVTENPNLGLLVKSGYLSLDQLYSMARGSDTNRDADLKAAGGKEALQDVASKQQAKAIHGAATTSAMGTAEVPKDNFDSWYAGLSSAERAKPETQKIVNILLS